MKKEYTNIPFLIDRQTFLGCPKINKGVEIADKKHFSLMGPLSQVCYASAYVHKEYASYNIQEFIDYFSIENQENDPVLATLTVPIIVTTSKIFCIEEGCTLEDIRENDINQWTTEVPAVCYINNNSFGIDKIENEKNEFAGISEPPEYVRWYRSLSPYDKRFIANRFRAPSEIYIISYDYIENCIQAMLEKINTILNL